MSSQRYDRTSEDAFLRMIVANPADDVARLVYADWLDEQGEPRAEFIRIQIALASGDLQTTERTQLTERATALYWKHHRYWNGQVYRQWIDTPLAANLARKGGLRGWRYRRGFPEVLDVSAEFFASHAELFLAAAPFQEVILRNLPQRLLTYFVDNEARLKLVEKLVLPNVHFLPNIPAGLVDRIRIGVRAQQTIAEYRADPLNRRGQVFAEQLIPAITTPDTNAEAAPRSVGQILRDVWRRIRGQ